MNHAMDQARRRWEEGPLADSLARFPERKARFETASHIPLKRIYLPQEDDCRYLERIGFPGQYPFTRGIHASMYRGRLWTMRQYAGYASAEETNQRFRYLLQQGQSGLSVAFDLPTQIGYDADHPLVEGEVGKVGVSICSLEDMQRLFESIPLDQISTSMTINAPAAILLAMYIAVAKSQGVDPKNLRGTIQNDILKEYVARGTYIFPAQHAMRLITDTFAYCRTHLPRWNPISISGYHMREAGATAVQEVAFTLANAIAYVQAALQAGLEVDHFGPLLTFFFSADRDFLEEIAKFRAARRLWARIMHERFNATDKRAGMMRFHTQTAGSSLTAQQPQNNIVRVALQALSAVLGGAQSLHTNSMDEALGLPSERAVSIALRTQQVLAFESGVANSVDPMAGSYLIEDLTDEIEKCAQELIQKIDDMGGALAAIEQGFMQGEIQDSAYRIQKAMDSGEHIVVGVNAFKDHQPMQIELLQVDPSIETSQRQRLQLLREKRNPALIEKLLADLAQAAQSERNLMPQLLACVEGYATLGEICGTLRRIWGEYTPQTII